MSRLYVSLIRPRSELRFQCPSRHGHIQAHAQKPLEHTTNGSNRHMRWNRQIVLVDLYVDLGTCRETDKEVEKAITHAISHAPPHTAEFERVVNRHFYTHLN